MKTKLFMLACLALVLWTGCKKVDFVEPTNPNPEDTTRRIEVSGFKVTLVNDTTNVQVKTVVTLKAVGPSTVTGWVWTIHDGTNAMTLSGQQVTLNAGFQILGVDLIQASGNLNGTTFTLTKYVKVVTDILSGNPVIFLSSHPTSSPDTTENWFALSKERMKFWGYYFHIGNYQPSNWAYPITVPAADTAYYLNGVTPVPAPSGDIGQYIVVKIKNAKNTHYEMGVGKIQGTNQIWGDFSGSQWVQPSNGFLIVWNTDANGVPIINGVSNDLPLVTGDVGNNAMIRLDQQDNQVVIGFNNGVPFSGNQPWVRFRDPGATWGTPIAQQPLPNWPNWGEYVLPYSQVPSNNLIRFRFGSNINVPDYLNPNMALSSMYDSFYNEERLILFRVTGMVHGGGTKDVVLVLQE